MVAPESFPPPPWSRSVVGRRRAGRPTRDPLTGLADRRWLLDRLDAAVRAGRRTGSVGTLLLLDLDRFAEVNHTVGHRYGDLLLAEVGRRLAAAVGPAGTVARLGADEFAVLLPSVHDVGDAVQVAERLCAAAEQPFRRGGTAVEIEVSIGVAVGGGPPDGTDTTDTTDALLRRADLAMRRAKRHTLGVAVQDPADDADGSSGPTLLGDLRRGLDGEEFVLYFQPMLAVGTGAVVGAEALARWEHPERGLVGPAGFILAAERSRLIGRFTRYVLDAALTQVRRWTEAGRPLPVAVNLSARNLLDDGLVDDLAGMLDRHGVPPAMVSLEITESALMVEPVHARRVLTGLRGLGVRLSVDDFGVGYTSLTHLTSLPLDEIKVDRAFVTTMTTDARNAVIVRSVVDLSHHLGLVTVAEGVESEESLVALRVLGCDVAQGYHLSRPLPADTFDRWYADRLAGRATGLTPATAVLG